MKHEIKKAPTGGTFLRIPWLPVRHKVYFTGGMGATQTIVFNLAPTVPGATPDKICPTAC